MSSMTAQMATVGTGQVDPITGVGSNRSISRISGVIMPKASHQDLRFAFRELLASGSCYHTASVFDPMSARIAADLGFEVGHSHLLV